jgi:DNA repair protein RecN (Recombination protein N)
LEESAFDLSRYLGKLDIDPGELTEVEDRLNTINRVLNKYGRTMEDALSHRLELAKKIAELERSTVDLSSIQKQIAPLTKELKALGGQLSAKRKSAAKKLAPLIEKQLAELGMEKAKFTIEFASASTDEPLPGPSGFDAIEFIAQTNPGQTAQPLRKIASGGELSRIMLALKGILAQSDRISVLVFDEIDANVGGRLGSIIGQKLRGLAAYHQVLCITHLPQIACYADRHLTVKKQISGNQTETTVRVMEGDERLAELAEMTGGPRVTETTRAQARELLESARAEFREKTGFTAETRKAQRKTRRKSE